MQIKEKILFLLQPLLISIYPIFHVYSRSIGEALFSDFVLLFFSFFVTSTALFFVINFVFKNWIKTSVALSVFWVCFYLFSPIYHYLENVTLFDFRIIRFRFFSPFWSLLILFFLFLIFRAKKVKRVFAKFLIVPFIFLIGFSIVRSLTNYRKIQNLINQHEVENKKFRKKYSGQFVNQKNLPDIYLIILDRYPSKKVLSKYFNFDNYKFLNSLKKKGFYVAANSRSNYVDTATSLPSSLNLNYHFVPTCYDDKFLGLAKHILQNNNAAYFLKSLNYKFFNFPSLWGPSRKKLPSNLNINYNLPSEFYEVFFGTTMIGLFWRVFFEYRKTKTILGQMNSLEKIVKQPGRKFVFAHISAPHDPFVFDKTGKFVCLKWPTDIESYLNQLQFISSKIDFVIDKILEKSKEPPIIILQSDHGVHWEEELFDKKNINDSDLCDVKYGILNAYYLPGFDQKKLWDTISPVNNFRLIFNNYFGSKFEILPDNYK